MRPRRLNAISCLPQAFSSGRWTLSTLQTMRRMKRSGRGAACRAPISCRLAQRFSPPRSGHHHLIIRGRARYAVEQTSLWARMSCARLAPESAAIKWAPLAITWAPTKAQLVRDRTSLAARARAIRRTRSPCVRAPHTYASRMTSSESQRAGRPLVRTRDTTALALRIMCSGERLWPVPTFGYVVEIDRLVSCLSRGAKHFEMTSRAAADTT